VKNVAGLLPGYMITPAGTVEIGCSRTRIAVTTPKFPPPPRSPEQVGLMLGVGGDEASVVQHDIGTQQVVQRQPATPFRGP